MTSPDRDALSAAAATPGDEAESSSIRSRRVRWWNLGPWTLPMRGSWSTMAVIGIVFVSIVIAWATLAIQYSGGTPVTFPTAFQTFGVTVVTVLLASLSFAKFERRGQQIFATLATLAAVLLSTGFLLP